MVHVKLSQNHMATTFDLVVCCESQRSSAAERALERAHLLVTRLESDLSEFLKDSPVQKINQSEVGEKVLAPSSVTELLDRSHRISLATHGAFNCTAKSDVSGSSLEELLGWDSTTGLVWKKDSRTHLGFGAIGKGYALDRVRTLLEQEGFENFILSAGGSSLILSGFAHPEFRTPWRWAWSWSKSEQGEPLGIEFEHRSGTPVAIGVSGTEIQGTHLIDPRSGLRVSSIKSAFFACRSAADADAFSTALFVLGGKAIESFDQVCGSDAAFGLIDQNEIPAWNARFERLWGEPPTQSSEGSSRTDWTAPALGALVAIASASFSTSARADDSTPSSGEEVVDLGSDSTPSFTPYLVDRSPVWMLLPAFMLALTLLHLKKIRIPIKRPKAKES